MKKIIDGVTYSTATSTAVARYERDADRVNPTSLESTLYQTRRGAFFVHVRESWGVENEHSGEWEERDKNDIQPKTYEEAHEWILEGDIEILADGVFPEPPEAEAEAVTGATIYLRMPAALKQRIEQAAKKADQSVNVWAMRCLETCAKSAAK